MAHSLDLRSALESSFGEFAGESLALAVEVPALESVLVDFARGLVSLLSILWRVGHPEAESSVAFAGIVRH